VITRSTALDRKLYLSEWPPTYRRENRRWLSAPGPKDPADVAFAVAVREQADVVSRHVLTLLTALAALGVSMGAIAHSQGELLMAAVFFLLAGGVLFLALVVLAIAARGRKALQVLYDLQYPSTAHDEASASGRRQKWIPRLHTRSYDPGGGRPA